MNYWIGINIGTTATEAVLYTDSGTIVATQSIAYELYRDPSGMAEEAPEDIFDAVVGTIRALSEKLTATDNLCAIGFSAQQHSLTATTSDFKPLTRTMTWADTRANAAATALRNSDQGYDIFMRTGTPLQPMSPLSNIVLAQTRPARSIPSGTSFYGYQDIYFSSLVWCLQARSVAC